MYTEALQTPHPQSSIYQPKFGREPLLQTVDLQAARQYIEHASHRTAATLEVAQHIDGAVHHSLRWEQDSWPLVTTESGVRAAIPEDQIVNCIGYALVTAELYKQVGIDHRIMYFNGHFMNGVVTGHTDAPRLHMFDAGNQSMSGIDITAALSSVTLSELLTQSDTGRGAARINTEAIIRQAGLDFAELEHANTYSWLHHTKGKGSDINVNIGSDPGQQRRTSYTCFLSMYSHATGERVLQGYSMLAANATAGDLDIALAGALRMGSLQPELDGRTNHKHIKSLVGRLAAADRDIDALTAAQDYCRSFSISNDTRVKCLEAGLYKKIAETTQDTAFRGLALLAYIEADERARQTSQTIQGKIRRLKALQGVAQTLTAA